MKTSKRANILKKREELTRQLKNKNMQTQKVMNSNRSAREDYYNNKLNRSLEMNQKIKIKVDKHFQKIEEKRIKEEQRSQKRSKIFIFLFK